ncbi:MAG: universal stress protein [Brevinematia bacterium]
MSVIYIPITGSPEGKKAYKKALSFAKRHNFEVVFIGILNIELVNKLKRYRVFIEEEVGRYNDTMKKDIEKYLDFMIKEAKNMGVEAREVILTGEPFFEIVNYIKNDNVDEKVLFVAKKTGGKCLKDILSKIERDLLLHTDISILVIGEEL